jgi:hypothetical protein
MSSQVTKSYLKHQTFDSKALCVQLQTLHITWHYNSDHQEHVFISLGHEVEHHREWRFFFYVE